MSARRPARTRMTAVAVIAAAAAVLVACSSGSSSSSETTAAGSASAVPSSAASASAVASPAFETVGCETLGLDPFFAQVADCGYVTVPENRTSGSDRTIKLAVLQVKAIGDNPGLPVMRG